MSASFPAGAVLTAAAALLTTLLFLFLRTRGKTPPALPGPPNGACKALFHRVREDAFLLLAQAHGRTLAYDGVVASSDPGVLRTVLLSRAHSVGRSMMYRLVATVMPSSDGILFSGDDAWRSRHNLFTPLFSGGHVRKFTAHMTASALVVAALHAQAGRCAPPHGERAGEGARLLASTEQGGDFSPPLGAPRPPAAGADAPGSAGESAGADMLTALRWVVLRVLLGWGLGLDVDTHGSHPALTARGYACACAPVKQLARCVDAYARICFEVMPEVERAGGRGWVVDWLRNYARLWTLSWRLKAVVADVIALEGVLWARSSLPGPAAAGDLANGMDNASCAARHGACLAGVQGDGEEDGEGSPLDPCPFSTGAHAAARSHPPLPAPLPADTFLSRMVSAGWSVSSITSEVNHLHGAHKAAAFLAHAGLVELTGRPEVRESLRQELITVCGAPRRVGEGGQPVTPRAWLQPLLAHTRAVAAAEGGAAAAVVSPNAPGRDAPGGCAFQCGWRPPCKSDLDAGSLPLLRCVWKETLRHHVVSMGTMRRLGEDLTVRVAPGTEQGGPAGDVKDREVVLPAGTELILMLHGLHHERVSWGPHAAWWLPERWDPASGYWASLRATTAARGGGVHAHVEAGPSMPVPPPGELPPSYTHSFLPFLEGVRRCAGMYTAELQFAAYAYAWTVLADAKAVLPVTPPADALGGGGDAGVGSGTRAGVDGTGVVCAREGAVAWVEDASGPGECGGQGRRLALIKRPDMFTGLDGHVAFTLRLL